MYFNDFQKRIIDSIVDKKVTSIDTFMLGYCELEPNTYKGGSYSIDTFTASEGTKIYIPKNVNLCIDRIKEFIVLWKLLERNGLIIPINRRSYNKRYSVPVFIKDGQQLKPCQQAFSLIKELDDFEIEYSPELERIKVNDYLSDEEIRYWEDEEIKENRYKEEEDARNKSLYWTRLVAISGIILSIVSSTITYLTFTTERNVKIVNYGDLPDTTIVKLIPNNLVQDSSFKKSQLVIKE